MTATSHHISVWIDRPADEVYAYACRPENLPSWAAGLGSGVEEVDGEWVVDSPMGRCVVAFAPHNPFGVLDHDVTLATGETVHNPLRVLPDAPGSEVVFTLRRRPGVSADDFARDAAAVTADLTTLKRLLEQRD